MYALKPKSVLEIHFRANSKKTQSLGKNGCRQKCLDKSLEANLKEVSKEFEANMKYISRQ